LQYDISIGIFEFMSKRDLKKFLAAAPKEELEEQLLALYEKFGDVKAYYNFIFNPKEDKLEQEAKLKISNEYFPVKSKRAKLRRSTAQKYIKQFLLLGVDPFIIADIMLYNIETAQKYTAKRQMRYASFYTSIFSSYRQASDYIISNSMDAQFKARMYAVYEAAKAQRWENWKDFERVWDNFE